MKFHASRSTYRLLFLIFCCFLFLLDKKILHAQNSIIFSDNHLSLYNTNENGLMLNGYDPVDLFRRKPPTKGNISFSTSYLGQIYYFSSKFNAKTFTKNPERYRPKYGGWCAYYMSLGIRKKTNSLYMKIIDDEIYTFSGLIPQIRFEEEKSSMTKNAEIAWQLFEKKHKEDHQDMFN